MTTGAPTSEASFPQHVAIIMDGNGRWAQARGQARTFGHKQGVETVRAIVKHASQIGLKHLTLYGFSSENWSRPPQEVSFLMGLLKSYFGARLAELLAGNVQVKVIGEHSAFSDEIRELLEKAEPDKADVVEIVSRIEKYIKCSANNEIQLPVAEAMVTYKEKR